MTKNKFISSSDVRGLYDLVSDPEIEIQRFDVVSEDVLMCAYKTQTPFRDEIRNSNIFLACFTTCYGRLRLYSVLQELGPRVMYYDTDSVIYSSKPHEADPPLGPYLGQLTSELPAGKWIGEFATGGPKQYCYKVHDSDETVVKLRGFRLNYRNSRNVTFDAMKKIIAQSFSSDSEPVEPLATGTRRKIGRQKLTQKVTARDELKQYKPVYTKRCIIRPSLDTLPYGYRLSFEEKMKIFNGC